MVFPFRALRLIPVRLREIRYMGGRFALRDVFRRIVGNRLLAFDIPGFGSFWIRLDSSDDLVFKQIFQDRQYDLEVFAGHRPYWKHGYDRIRQRGSSPIVLDLGANNGASTAWFATQFPDARVVAVEPDADNFAMLAKNVAAIDNVSALNGAIGSVHGQVSLSPGSSRDWGVRSLRDPAGDVEVFSVAEAVNSRLDDLFLVKIDIEGFEDDLFSASLEWVDNVSVIIIEPHDWMLPGCGSSTNFQSVLGPRGFDLLLSGENLVYVRAPHGSRTGVIAGTDEG